MKLRLICFSVALVMCAVAFRATQAQSSATLRMSPSDLVTDLYKQHNRKRGPFQITSRTLLYKYFDKTLADLIWKDAKSSKGEVGVIDGDPLYDAQDFDIKNFAVAKAVFTGGTARVNVTFDNLGEHKTLGFLMVNGRTGWRIKDIDYGEGRTLLGEFKESRH